MKILHSFWSKPMFSPDIMNEGYYLGWINIRYFLVSWTLSCLSFKKFYKNVELVTDERGYQLLIKCLKLPYSHVEVRLDDLNHYSEDLWALGKIYSYSLQNKPFIHVDGDVFLWKPFDSKLENADLISQHLDTSEGPYVLGMKQLREANFKIPNVLINDHATYERFLASNAGIIGGTNTAFFREYSDEVFNFVDANIDLMHSKLNYTCYALIYEQYMFSAMARKKEIEIAHLIDTNEKSEFQLANFLEKYQSDRFVHLFGFNKRSLNQCHEMEMQLVIEYPEYHKRILEVLIDNQDAFTTKD